MLHIMNFEPPSIDSHQFSVGFTLNNKEKNG